MVRFLLFLLGTLSADRSARRAAAWYPAGDSPWLMHAEATRTASPAGARPTQPVELPPWHPHGADTSHPDGPGGNGGGTGSRRRRVPPWVTKTAVVVAIGLVFRRAIASMILMALSAALHLAGIGIHLPSVRFAWPWQAAGQQTTANTDLGPWVLQKIEGISRPALGQANFSFVFTHKVSKNIGPLPCWYSSTFYAVGHASATVNLNPGPAWWKPAVGHYRLQILSHPQAGQAGHVTVAMVLPRPQLPQSVHDVTIDSIPSKPIATQHSWTYPGFGCGVLLRPQFPESVLYSEAQRLAFYRSSHVPQITGPLITSAETTAERTIRNNFVQPTLNALGYTLDRFTVSWIAAPVTASP